MEKLIGRARFHGIGIKFHDESNQHERMEQSLYPNADPGDPDAGTRIEDEGDPVPAAALEILKECEDKLRALGFAGRVTFIAQTTDETPIETFKRASDKRWGIGSRKRAADAIVPSSMTSMQRFIAASKTRWGLS